MSVKSSQEQKQKHIEVMGKDLGLLYDSIKSEIMWMQMKWEDHVALFGTNNQRIALINSTAPYFFYAVQTVFYESVILGITRLTDPVKANDQTNVSIRGLCGFVKDQDFRSKAGKQVKKIGKLSEGFRVWRNKLIAHNDPNFDHAESMKAVDKEMMNEILKEFRELIIMFEEHYFNSTIVGLENINLRQSAKTLLEFLAEGKRSRDLRISYSRNNKPIPDELKRIEI